jgi:hypothetical protein
VPRDPPPGQTHKELMHAAVERDGAAQRALISGDTAGAREAFGEAAALYRESWELASATSYGRLIGMLKAAVLAGGGEAEARYARSELGGRGTDSAPAAYALALAALVLGDDAGALAASEQMLGGSDAFIRTARAIAALAAGDRERYAEALTEIVSDFEQRAEHLTGVAMADTALTLQVLAARRGVAAALSSDVLPAI